MIRLSIKIIRLTAIIIPIMLAVICLAQVVKNYNQASMPIPKEYVFSGEYSYNGENWYLYSEDSDISALKGDIVIKGHLDSDIAEGAMLEFHLNNYHKYGNKNAYKEVLSSLLIIFLFYGAKQVILYHQASIKNKKLKEELEQSRISVMLSQIQPHFLYNSLTSVMDLCDTNPKQAKAAIADFADYLRGNLSSLKTENPISFRTELEHIKKYLRLEKLRFQDELEVAYDIQTQDFMLPALSVQPLVENAVKHGIGQKIGGGTVIIHTHETENEYIIRITDDGVGFVEGEYADDGGTHIGIENTKKRFDMMMNARLELESMKGEGTTACILIPKRRD